jgi:hypothetical protein
VRSMPLLTAIALLLIVSSADARLSAFKSPTGNITCVMSTKDGGFAQCELRSKPYGGGLSVPSRGRVSRYDVASYDDIAAERFVLRYGESRSLGRFTCTSRSSGMTCRNTVTHHGFTMSREAQTVF